ncbi:MAG: hypothetical protein ACD_54C00434G0001, partial [uncultured bacterium]
MLLRQTAGHAQLAAGEAFLADGVDVMRGGVGGRFCAVIGGRGGGLGGG